MIPSLELKINIYPHMAFVSLDFDTMTINSVEELEALITEWKIKKEEMLGIWHYAKSSTKDTLFFL